MTRAAKPGDLVVYASSGAATGVYAEQLIARVDSVRERHLTGFPWRMGDRRWDKRQFRIDPRRVMAVLPADANVAAIAEGLNELRNEREMRKARIDTIYRNRIKAFAIRAARGAA